MALRTKGRAKSKRQEDAGDGTEDAPTVSVGTRFFYQGPTPEKFDFKSDEWARWLKRFERYRVSSGLWKEPDQVQVSCLMGHLGDEGEDILSSFGVSEDDLTYDLLVDRFAKYFEKKINVIFERARFRSCYQEEGEAFDSFLTRLHHLVKLCNYSQLKDEMIRDQIVIGLHDSRLSEKLQLDSNLTLESAIYKAKQSELVKSHQTVVRGQRTVAEVAHGEARGISRYCQKPARGKGCFWCGQRAFHARDKCPAVNAKCNFCRVEGHFEKCCFKKKRSANEVNLETAQRLEEDDSAQLGLASIHLNAISGPMASSPYMVSINLNTHAVRFKVDTGADATCVPVSVLEAVGIPSRSLDPYFGRISHAGRGSLTCLGTFCATLSRGLVSIRDRVFVIKELAYPLLGRSSIEGLKLLSFNTNGSSLLAVNVEDSFTDLFQTLPRVMVGDPYKIKLKDHSIPYAITAPRRVPLALAPAVREELKRMEDNNIIAPITEGTEWCAPIVVVGKKDGSIRLCVDYTELNKFVVRERLVLPSTEDSLAKIKNAKIFSKLDARMGFWQVALDEQSQKITTFITPFGRYYFKRLPFGICSAPEHYQKRICQALDGLEGCANLMDDVLIFGATLEEHDHNLRQVLERFKQHNVTLNKEKCTFRTTTTMFLGHLISAEGIAPDPKKTEAVRMMAPPKDVKELRRFLGMYNYLTRFVKDSADVSKPLRDLLRDKTVYLWSEVHSQAFDKMKSAMASAPILQQYDPNAPTRVSADSSSYALGGVLEQSTKGQFRPVMYISRGLSDAERGYAQIEKEALALTWACERFSLYLLGRPFQLQTDHKPLLSLMGSKPVVELTPRLQRLRLRLTRFDYALSHVSGKDFHIPDVLSRAAGVGLDEDDLELGEVLRQNDNLWYQSLPVSDVLHKAIKEHYLKDEVLQSLIKKLAGEWQEENDPCLRQFHKFRHLLSCHDGMILYGTRIVVPKAMRSLMMDKIHSSHLGVTKCRKLAQETVWWPGITADIERRVKDCYTCARFRSSRADPLLPTELPQLPWSTVGVDFLKAKGEMYLILQDYFSRFLEVHHIRNNQASTVIGILKQIFARHGVPHKVRSDNGPPFNSHVFQAFAKQCGFELVTSSPTFPQSNGLAESAVKTAKMMIMKCADWAEGLLLYNATSLENGYSPSELLMGRKLRTSIPVLQHTLKPSLVDERNLRSKEETLRDDAKRRYDHKHGVASERPELRPGQEVWITNMKTAGRVVKKLDQPRAYLVETERGGRIQRNRFHLVPFKHAPRTELKKGRCGVPIQ